MWLKLLNSRDFNKSDQSLAKVRIVRIAFKVKYQGKNTNRIVNIKIVCFPKVRDTSPDPLYSGLGSPAIKTK